MLLTDMEATDLRRIQRRVVGVLAAAQVFGGVGVATGVAVGALLATDLGNESLSGLAAASSVIGAALIFLPVSRLMDRHGRRAGLLLAYGIGTTGTMIIIAGALLRLLPLARIGLILTGAAPLPDCNRATPPPTSRQRNVEAARSQSSCGRQPSDRCSARTLPSRWGTSLSGSDWFCQNSGLIDDGVAIHASRPLRRAHVLD